MTTTVVENKPAVSQRAASMNQVQVLYGASAVGSESGPRSALTEGIHAWREAMQVAADKKPATVRQTYLALLKCFEYGWLVRRVVDEVSRSANPNEGAGIEWTITQPGRAAMDRGRALLAAKDAEGEDEPSEQEEQEPAADAPPEGMPWDGEPTPGEVPTADADALKELDEEVAAADVEVEEPVETHVVEGSNQLTMLVVAKGSTLKPTQFTLKINAKQIELGTTREHLLMERIPFSGVLEVRKVVTEQKDNGRIVKVAHAIVAECDIVTPDEDA